MAGIGGAGGSGGSGPDPIDNLNNNFTLLISAVNNLANKINGNSTQTQSNNNIIDSLIHSNNQNANQNNINARDQARLLDQLDQSTQENTDSITSLELGISALKTAFSTFTKFVGNEVSRVLDSADAIRDAFNSNLNQITTVTGETTDKYSETITRFEADIRAHNLDNALRLSEYYNQYAELLDQGFTEDQASRSTLSTLVAKKVIPGLNASNRAYQYLTRTFGPTFQDNLTSIALYSRQQYGKLIESTGISTSLIEDLYANLDYWSAKNGADFNAIQNEIYATTAMVTSSMGEEVGSQFEQMLAQLASDIPSASSSQLLRAIETVATQHGIESNVTESQSFFTFLNENQGLLGEIANQWAITSAQMVDSLEGNAIGVKGLADEGFANRNTLYNIAAYIERNGSLDLEELAKVLAEQRANPDKPIEDLSNEMYQTATDITKATDENRDATVFLSDLLSNKSDQWMEQATTIANGVADIFKLLVTSLLFKNIIGSGGGKSGNLLGNLLGTGGTAGGSITARVGNFLSSGLGRGLTGIAGTILIAQDAVSGYTDALNNGATQVEAIGEGAKEALVGDLEQEDLSGQLGAVGKNMLKWGAIGNTVFPGLGAVVGGAGGAIATSFGYLAKNAEVYDDFFHSSGMWIDKAASENEILIKNLKDLADNTKIYNDSLDNANRLQGLLNEKKQGELDNEERAELNRLKKEAEDAANSLINNINNVNFDKLTESEEGYQLAGLVSRLEEVGKEAQGKSVNELQVQYLDYIDKLIEQGILNEKDETQINTLRSRSAEVNSAQDLTRILASIESYQINKEFDTQLVGQDQLWRMIDSEGKFEYDTDIYTKFESSFLGKSNDNLMNQEDVEALSGMYSNIDNINNSIAKTVDTLKGLDTESDVYKMYQKQLEKLVTAYENAGGKEYLTEFLTTNNIILTDYLPQHAEGLGYVPYDGYVSALHEGEMVLTSELSDKIRSMTEIPARDDINSLADELDKLNDTKNEMTRSSELSRLSDTIANTTITPQVIVDNSSLNQSINNVTTAINSQTAQLLEALVTIYDIIKEVGGKEPPKNTYTSPTPNFIYN